MLISEAIKKLEKIKKEHGDIQLVISTEEVYDDYAFLDVETIEADECCFYDEENDQDGGEDTKKMVAYVSVV